MNIDACFRQSDQRMFHSRCRCLDGVVLSSVFPECIGDKLPGFTPSLQKLPRRFWVCPTCGEPIENPRIGRWVQHNAESEWGVGHHIPQILSSRQSADSIYRAYESARDRTEFYNSKLGIPYIDPCNQLITPGVLEATVNPDLRWQSSGTNCAMGVDQMGGYNVVVIRKWGSQDETGKRKSVLVHIEIIYSDDPFRRCGELMNIYEVSACVIDGMPNHNDAHRFVKEFPGRVWLADYSYRSSGIDEICEWMDRPHLNAQQKRAAEETRNKYRVRIDRYKAMEWNLNAFVDRRKAQPHQMALTQQVKDPSGRFKTTALCAEVYWLHLQRIVREVESVDESQGRMNYKFVHVGLDPHFAHADLYAELALSRARPQRQGLAFSEFAVQRDQSATEGKHQWVETERQGDYKCTKCGITIRWRNKTIDRDELAARNGYQFCKRKGG